MSDSDSSAEAVATVATPAKEKKATKPSLLTALREKRVALEKEKSAPKREVPVKKTVKQAPKEHRSNEKPEPESEPETETVVVKKEKKPKKIVYVEEESSEEEEVIVRRQKKTQHKSPVKTHADRPPATEPKKVREPVKREAPLPMTGYTLLDNLLFSKR